MNQSFNHPNVSKALALETLKLNISLTPQEVTDLAARIRIAVLNLTGVEAILKESEKDYNASIALKEEALRAKYVFMSLLYMIDYFLC